ncbi:T9SS type A sorting domain-containing protein [candidate division WOR-3 bacterium]|uniref:T9SS type A sorting domain-containing protein n=1 Tax=candidate division WOR-3 bacterium TaxID=2052148 RepID=A0A9D5KB31_UNCW3|nr:T9SS type A sorting domain-containing protein [candidate division WOR-3 bacterium]MBD3365656.1 T9SS type A sorting domain-containing protein [candidate division WOR-3 bacterium]
MKKHLVLLTLLLVAGIIVISPAQTWTVEQITDNAEDDIFPFATRVPSGFMVVYTHFDGDNESFVASNTGGSWTTSRVTDNSRSDIGFDIASRPGQTDVHIALWWNDVPDGEISYTSGGMSGWDTERVTDDADDDAWPSIEIDQNGFAHMVYQKNTGGDLEVFYSNNVTGGSPWPFEQVTDNATADGFPWLALDSGNNPHIVFTDGAQLFYTKKTAGIWTTPNPIFGGFGTNSFPYLVLDRDDNVHICYAKSDGVDNEIYYANNVTGDWQESKVTSNDYHDYYPTLLVDAAGKVHIAYQDNEADAEIFYANNVSGVWDFVRVTDNSVSDAVALGQYFITDGQGHGNIFFWNNSDGDDEIYVARSNQPIIAGIEEVAPVATLAINLDQTVFSNTNTIRYSITRDGNVTIKVFDASGSLVETLVNGPKSAGEHTVNWNGETDAGVKASPGVYFLHLTAAGKTASVKAVLK